MGRMLLLSRETTKLYVSFSSLSAHGLHLKKFRANTSQRRAMGMWPKVRPIRVRVITCDVTGTLLSFRGSLEEHYLGSAEKCGVEMAPDVPIGKAFNRAYKEVCQLHPCFGGSAISGKDWWKLCVSKSFEYAGVDNMTEDQKERVFQRIFSAFGSLRAYEVFSDTLPFLHFAARNHVVCGVLSNADERYRDSILPSTKQRSLAAMS